MAIDKNSKAYQNLLNSGYSDQQIMDMYNRVSSGQSRQEVVASTQPVNTPTTQPTTQSTTPAAQPTEQPTQQPTQTTPEVKQETETKQQETAGTTVPEIKQEGALTPLSQEYYNQVNDNALNTIRDNLNRYKQSNPEYFTDYESFKSNFSYNARNEQQKSLLDDWYNGYQNGLTLSNTPTSDLYTQYKNGDLSNTQLENLRIANPTKYSELQAQINKGNIVQAYDDDKGEENIFDELRTTFLNNMLTNLTAAGSESSVIFDKYKENMESPEMLELSDKTTEIQEQIENVQDQISTMTKSVEAEYAGTGATRSKINAIVADRTYDLQLQLRTLNSEYNKYATQYNNRMQQYQTEFNMELQEYQLGMQERNQKMSELGFAMDLMNYETPQQKEEREWNYWVRQQEYANGDINSKDPTARYKAALKSVQNLLSQYEGIPMQRSAEQMAQDIIKAIDEGSDLGAELTKINQQIQSKPEYKYLYNQTYKSESQKGFGNYMTIGGTDYVEYNGKLYTADDFNKQFGGNGKAKEYKAITQEQLNSGKKSFFNNFDSKYSSGKGGWCGAFVNDYLQTLGVGRYYDNDLSTKLNSINTQMPTIGSIAVFDYGHITKETGKNHGHVAIVTDILPDGRIQVMDSNFDGDFKIKERLIDPNSVSLKGYFDPTIPYGGASASLSSTTKNGTSTTTSSVVADSDGTITLGSTKLTPEQFDSYVKEYIDGNLSYSEVDKLGDGVLNKVTQRKYELLDQGYTPSTKITDPNKIATLEGNFRKEYDKLTEDVTATINWVQKMDDAYAQVDENLNTASQALVIAYNKILDESSVVREGEYARTSDGQSFLEQMKGKVQQIAGGGAGITKENLKSLVDLAHTFSDNAKAYRDEAAQRTMVSINKYGLTPEAVLPISVLDSLNASSIEDEDYWSEFRSSTPQGVDTINVGNGLSITWP